MELWTVFATGLLAGGASCAVVQGGLLTGLLARRGARGASATASKNTVADATSPISAFLAGKLASHAVLGALLGAVGDAVQLGFRTRALTQGVAGAVMVLLALHMLGVRGLAFLIPAPPETLRRVVRRGTRSDAVAAPALLGLATVFLPCGVTLSVALLAIASGSALAGMLIMSVFVLGTVPLFAVLGYAARRSSAAFGGRLAKVTAVLVLGAGLYTVSGGLALAGAPMTVSALRAAVPGTAFDADALATPAAPGPSGSTPVGPHGTQVVEIRVGEEDYRIASSVRPGIATRIILITDGVRGCTRGFVIPSLGIERVLPERGRTAIEVGELEPGQLAFTCSMGMYGGELEVHA